MKTFPARFLVRLLVCLAAVSLTRAQTPLPDGGESLLPPDVIAAMRLTTMPTHRDDVNFMTVDASGPGFTRAWRIETTRDSSPPWAIELRTGLTAPVKAGDVALVRFFARALMATDETGGGQLRVAVQRGAPNFQQSAD